MQEGKNVLEPPRWVAAVGHDDEEPNIEEVVFLAEPKCQDRDEKYLH